MSCSWKDILNIYSPHGFSQVHRSYHAPYCFNMLSTLAARGLKSEIDDRNRLLHTQKTGIENFLLVINAYFNLRWYEGWANGKPDIELVLSLLDERGFTRRVVQEPPSLKFIASCPTIGLRRIPAAERTCPVCANAYVSRSSNADLTVKLETSVPRKLPCNHIICAKCVDSWFSPFTDQPRNTCPFCRHVCFPPTAPEDTAEGLQSRSDLVDLLIDAGQVQLTDDDKVMTHRLKIDLLLAYNRAAAQECEDWLRASRSFLRAEELRIDWMSQNQHLVLPQEQSDMHEFFLRCAVIQFMRLELVFRTLSPENQAEIGPKEDRELLDSLAEARRIKNLRSHGGR